MYKKSLTEKKNRIILLEEEIRKLNEKKFQLEKLKQDYYQEYFDLGRNDFSLLHDIPTNPILEKHILYDYSALNIDIIGKIICELIKKYENKTYVSRRVIHQEKWYEYYGGYDIKHPILVIGKEGENVENANNIIIKYNDRVSLRKYPTNDPVAWISNSNSFAIQKSNYDNLISYYDGLIFDYHNLSYIRDLLFSLAYYQKQHNIEQMSSSETWNVYQKIYQKKQ